MTWSERAGRQQQLPPPALFSLWRRCHSSHLSLWADFFLLPEDSQDSQDLKFKQLCVEKRWIWRTPHQSFWMSILPPEMLIFLCHGVELERGCSALVSISAGSLPSSSSDLRKYRSVKCLFVAGLGLIWSELLSWIFKQPLSHLWANESRVYRGAWRRRSWSLFHLI